MAKHTHTHLTITHLLVLPIIYSSWLQVIFRIQKLQFINIKLQKFYELNEPFENFKWPLYHFSNSSGESLFFSTFEIISFIYLKSYDGWIFFFYQECKKLAMLITVPPPPNTTKHTHAHNITRWSDLVIRKFSLKPLLTG